jgi:hypothetical protein
MKRRILICSMVAVLAGLSALGAGEAPGSAAPDDHLVILWTSGEKDVFTKVVLPYGVNSKKQNWWKAVTLIVWGPSARLLSEEEALQAKIRELGKAGVHLTACKWCADQYGVSDDLAGLGIEVKYMGKALTEYLKSGYEVMVF